MDEKIRRIISSVDHVCGSLDGYFPGSAATSWNDKVENGQGQVRHNP